MKDSNGSHDKRHHRVEEKRLTGRVDVLVLLATAVVAYWRFLTLVLVVV